MTRRKSKPQTPEMNWARLVPIKFNPPRYLRTPQGPLRRALEHLHQFTNYQTLLSAHGGISDNARAIIRARVDHMCLDWLRTHGTRKVSRPRPRPGGPWTKVQGGRCSPR